MLCRDRAMTMGCVSVPGSAAIALGGAGTWFWRVQAMVGGAMMSSAVWEFFISNNTSATDLANANAFGPSFLDVNGDGLADVFVAGNPTAGANRGQVNVYLGRPGGPSMTPSMQLDGPDGPGGLFGASIASAGDLNGDGFGDVVIGAPGASRAHVYLGRAAGIPLSPDVSLSAATEPTGLGTGVAGIGDIDDDGYGDLAVGSPLANGGRGRIHLYTGASTGVFGIVNDTIESPNVTDHAFGQSIASLGDWTGDGLADFAVAAPATTTGEIFIFAGLHGGLPTTVATTITRAGMTNFGLTIAAGGDIDNDGHWDLLAGCSDNVLMTTFAGNESSLGVSLPSVASVGDINGDGFADWAYSDPTSAMNSGRVRAEPGSSGSSLSTLVTIVGTDGTASNFGSSMANAGDVDGNGYLDLLIGESLAMGATATQAHAYLFMATAGGLTGTTSFAFSGGTADPGFGHPVQ